MLDFYTRKVRATNMVDELYKKGFGVAIITLNVQKRYGFGRNFIENRINILDESAIEATKNTEKPEETGKNEEVLGQKGEETGKNEEVLADSEAKSEEVEAILQAKPTK